MLRAVRRLLPLLAVVALFASPPMTAAQSGSAPAAAPAVKRSQYIYVLRLAPRLYDQKAWTEADNAAVGRHFARLKQATETGQVILAGRTTEPLDKTFGLVVFEADDEAAARAFMEADPAVVSGQMTATLHPYAVALLRKQRGIPGVIAIRPLQAADATAYRSLRLAALAAHPTAFAASVEDEHDTPLDTLATQLSPRTDAVVLGAFDGDRLIGTVGVQRERLRKLAHKAHVWGMYVEAAARGRGVGRQLLAHAITHAARMSGVRQLTLGVNAQNDAALALYEAHGFVQCGLEPGFLLVDGVLHDEIHMVRFLD